LSSVLVGAGIAVSRLALGEVPPLTLAMLRYAIGFACLLPFAWGMRLRGSLRDMTGMALLGIGQFGVLIALLNFGLQRIGAAQAALIFSLFPLITLVLSSLLGHERITLPLLAGVLVSIAGVALSLAPKLEAHGTSWWGELAVLGAAAIGAACSVLYRPYLRRYPTLPVSAFAMLASVLVLALVAWPEHWVQRVPDFSGAAWAATIFVGVSSGIGYFAWLYALKHESPTRVTVFLALNPPTAALMGWVMLGEPVHAGVGAGLLFVGAGLWLATRGGNKPPG
jgi:drug/metabolite transporter (DMT)-like permease